MNRTVRSLSFNDTGARHQLPPIVFHGVSYSYSPPIVSHDAALVSWVVTPALQCRTRPIRVQHWQLLTLLGLFPMGAFVQSYSFTVILLTDKQEKGCHEVVPVTVDTGVKCQAPVLLWKGANEKVSWDTDDMKVKQYLATFVRICAQILLFIHLLYKAIMSQYVCICYTEIL